MDNTLKDIQSNLQKAILENEFDKFFDYIKSVLSPQSPIISESNLIQSRLNDLRQRENDGVIGFQDASIIYNQLRKSLQQLISKITLRDLIGASPDDPLPLTKENAPSNLTSEEKAGIQSQLEILIQKLNFIRKHRATENDPSIIFKYENQIKELEQEIQLLKLKLGKH